MAETPAKDAEDDGSAAETSAGPRRRPSLLQRLLPEAPPLPGKPDPLAGFHYRGPALLRGVGEGAYLLTRNAFAWLAPGMGWTLAHVVPIAIPAIAFLSTTLEFGSLIAAGVLGWQRPWLFGAFAAFFGSIVFGAFVIALAAAGNIAVPGTSLDLTIGLVSYATLQALVGAVAGWFGGYWRRRFAQASELRRRHQRR